jgi:hypothetical protein
MMCCGIGAVAIATAMMGRRPCNRSGKQAGMRTSLAATLAAVAASITLSALGAQHFGHYLERARANERSLLAEIMAQPVCTGSPAVSLARAASAEPFQSQFKRTASGRRL